MSPNLDAEWLREFASTWQDNGMKTRLLAIAQHLASMEEKLAAAEAAGSYQEGYLAGQASAFKRSNLVDSRQLAVKDGRVIVDSLAATKVARKIPQGVSGLPAAPAKSKIIDASSAKRKPVKRGWGLDSLA